MDKEKVKEQLGDAATKAKGVLAEVKANFKADEGTTGFRKVQSMFVNLWKSGTTGKGALIACSVVVLLLLCLVFSGGGKSDATSRSGSAEVASGESAGGTSGESAGGTSAADAQKAKRPVPADTLVVKGLYMRMPGDEALEACKEMIASSDDLVVVDFRNGVEIEREVGLDEFEKKQMDEWTAHMGKRRDFINGGHSEAEADEAGLKNYNWEGWKKEHPLSEKDIAESKKKIKEVVSKANKIQISLQEEGVTKDKLKYICVVSIDDQGKVSQVFFYEDGMDRLFNAADLSGEEFAQSLVNNYSAIPSLKKEEKRERVQQFGYSETCKWIYKDPKGFQVDLYERVFIDAQGRRFSSLKKLNASNMMLATALVAAGKKPSKCFYITAIQPESARKFD